MSTTSASLEGAVTLQQINEVHANVLDNNPIYKYLLSDLEIKAVQPGYIEAHVPVSKTLMNSKNILHGSTSATIIDWIGGIVIASTSPDRFTKRGVSVDIHATYVGAAKEGDTLIIKGKSNKVGRNLAFIDVQILGRKSGGRETGEDDRVVVTGSHTKFVG
ncbi:Thioesterase superfamily [Kalmanozyma brasiliensis GHG001]|uniref:HGG motif-containing thioesterase n=1 Tax=Kalmanozyma brasiliensis (strain GHG001) TaxID=1365824 RepID=V5GSW3_KALBG|nr:Thioesterase superfamily [Kalmanozyma brasiliensis GHG001]EST09012.1 Thioesterase superfamily [Kalmanozyma brasiliensis GHG001]